jgi:hypothetical protein
MTTEYIPLIISASQVAQKAIEQKTSHDNTKRRELKED